MDILLQRGCWIKAGKIAAFPTLAAYMKCHVEVARNQYNLLIEKYEEAKSVWFLSRPPNGL
jgi:hypothetical protein